jgi:acetate kinase
MAFTLVVNPGSSSKKFALYLDRTLKLTAYIERSADGFEMCTAIGGTQQKCNILDKNNYKDSLDNFLKHAVSEKYIEDYGAITKVAVRVVAPGTYFQSHREVDVEYLDKLTKLSTIAPLHIPHLLQEIEAIKKFLPAARILAISDSAFHSTMPAVSRQYAIGRTESERYDIYRFGYHGLSVASVMRRVDKVAARPVRRAIVCHIGSGVSVTAVSDGKSVDTTMGYAPGSGLVMGSRAGDIDPGALLVLMQAQNLKPSDAQVYLQTGGGMRALGGESDLRVLLERRARGDAAAEAAIQSFVYHIQKAIGAYVAILGGVDTLIFTATASERSPALRALIVKKLAGLQITIDTDKNESLVSRDGVLSVAGAAVEVLVLKTNEADEILHASLGL